MIRFCCTNRLESLVDALAETVGGAASNLFDPVSLVVPNPLVEAFVKQGLARRLGIAAHVETSFLRGFLYDVARASRPGVELLDRDRVEGELLALFHDPGRLSGEGLGAVREYRTPTVTRWTDDRHLELTGPFHLGVAIGIA